MTPQPSGPAVDPSALPKGLKRAAVVTMVLSAMVGFGASHDLAAMFESPSYEAVIEGSKMMKFSPFEPKVQRDALEASWRAQQQGYESMRVSRVAILLVLSMLSSLVFISALRFLRPNGVPREGIRRLLGIAAVVCAVVRTLDGAQMTAVQKRAGAAVDAVYSLAGSSVPGGYPDGAMAFGLTLAMVLSSLIFAGGYAMVGAYFRSQRTRDVVATLDQRMPG